MMSPSDSSIAIVPASSRVRNGYFVEWYVPTAPLEAGEHVITYSVTWTTRVFDGYAYFGPGSATLTESGTCTFTVQ
jgi:hypothetical protein